VPNLSSGFVDWKIRQRGKFAWYLNNIWLSCTCYYHYHCGILMN